MKIVKEILRQIDAVRLRRHMRARMRHRFKHSCLKGAIEEYRRYSPEYADRLELLLYPKFQYGGGEKYAGSNTAE